MGCYAVGVSSLCSHFDVMPSMVWSLHFVARIVSMMMCYYSVAYPGAVMMDMMMIADLAIPDLLIVAIVCSISYEKCPLSFPYCTDLSSRLQIDFNITFNFLYFH